jgi:hypothetical protein
MGEHEIARAMLGDVAEIVELPGQEAQPPEPKGKPVTAA